MLTANEIRRQFIDFFAQKHGHTFVPSSSVVPWDDPTLLFTNAGMNQFKDVFLGTGTRPYRRAVNSQKCIRAGGKHNDLDDVGKDTYHHTFFEMLGNWSFGDYFKKEAIGWAWELLTRVWGLDKSRLHATVFEGGEGLVRDEEAAAYWRSETDIDPAHIHWGSRKDNFWEMGETGPCGPCTEIHIDRTPDKSGAKLVNAGKADVIEIWNLVFIQFNRGADKKLTPLPAQHVDTGMGFERITAVLQGKSSNYDTDVFTPILEAIGQLTSKKYGGRLDDMVDVGFRVIADHLRMAVFAITDGARPGNKKRDAILRSVIRRAVRFAVQYFNQHEPLLYQLVPVVVGQMGGAYPELKHEPSRVAEIIHGEEIDFLRTLGRGMELFDFWAHHAELFASGKYATEPAIHTDRQGLPSDFIPAADLALYKQAGPGRIPAQAVFRLHTESGLPPDLTEQMARERGLTVDMEGYKQLMLDHERISRGKIVSQEVATELADLPATNDRLKWTKSSCDAKVLYVQSYRGAEGPVALYLDQTCFYGESGGQVGDTGRIWTETGVFEVTSTLHTGHLVSHIGQILSGTVRAGETAHLEVSSEREFTRRNHTATHLLHWALHRVLGEHVEQRGSKVKPDQFTFDFSHTGPLTAEQRSRVEWLVNEKVYEDLPVTWRELPIAEAKTLPGVKQFFGDKYGDIVRVVEVEGGFSREFCGGTHLDRTGKIGYFKIVGEEAVGKGVRRVTCVTAREAIRVIQTEDSILADLMARFRCKAEEIPARVESLQEENKKLQQQLKRGGAGNLQGAADVLLAEAVQVNGARIIVGEMPAGSEEQIRQQIDRVRQKAGSAVVVVGWADDGKVMLIAAVTEDLVKKGLHAGKLIGQVAKVVGGGGGGKPTMAQAGGKEPAKLAEALQLARKLAGDLLAKSQG